ncbi:MAG: DUF5615 family PIN-like protein [Acidimicrobiales bacterium]
MRFLVDQCLSPDFAAALAAAGHDVVHVRDLGMVRAPDADVLALARTQDRTLLSADTDFGTILAQTSAVRPSVVIFRRMTRRRPSEQAALLLANLPAISGALDGGSVVVIEEGRMRVRTLPIVEYMTDHPAIPDTHAMDTQQFPRGRATMMTFQPGRVFALTRPADDDLTGGHPTAPSLQPAAGGSGPLPPDLRAARAPYLMPAEVAALVGVSPRTVSRWASAGRIPCFTALGGHRRYRRADVLRVRDEGGSEGTPPAA